MFRLNEFQTRLYSGFGTNVCEAVIGAFESLSRLFCEAIFETYW